MKEKLSNYIARMLVEQGICHVFTVTGGGAMHLNDGLGHQEGLTCIYNHHEQACAMAAESYARIHNKIAAVCVTTGPGGTNAITGVVGGWLDSIPMLILSGQVRYDTTARSTGLGIRAMGDQEFDITKAVGCMTKYSEMVIEPERIRYCLEKALYLAKSGRPGPCWLDIPANVQSAYIDPEELNGFDPDECKGEQPMPVSSEQVKKVAEMIQQAKRPVFYAGNGIRIAKAHDVFRRVAEKLNIPVVTGWDSIDMMEDNNPLYTGRGGIMGDRAGNFAVQNSDLVLAVGNRLSIRQVGYAFESWAREAVVIMVDVDAEEMKKPDIHCDMAIHADALDFLQKMDAFLSTYSEESGKGKKVFAPEWMPGEHAEPKREGIQNDQNPYPKLRCETQKDWLTICGYWKRTYPVVQPKHYEETDRANVYAFIKELSQRLSENQITVVGNGSACVVGSHAYVIKKGQRFIINSAIASMGYDLPAAIGACVAEYGDRALRKYRSEIWAGAENHIELGMAGIKGKKENTEERRGEDASLLDIILVTGDGSIQMNLQELQTIIHHQMPIKIFIINNNGYHSIRQTQTNFFGEPLVGIGYDSGDLSFPVMKKLAVAYGYPYFSIEKNAELSKLESILAQEGPLICEIVVSPEQKFEPKSASKCLPDGTMVSAPLEDLAPFLPKEEVEANMLIPIWKEW